AEDLVGAREEGLDLLGGPGPARRLRLPGETEHRPPLVEVAAHDIPPGDRDLHVVRRDRRARAAPAGPDDPVVPEEEAAALEPRPRLGAERNETHAREALARLRRLQLAAVPEEDRRGDDARVLARGATHVLRTQQAMVPGQHPLHDVDLRVLQA